MSIAAVFIARLMNAGLDPAFYNT